MRLDQNWHWLVVSLLTNYQPFLLLACFSAYVLVSINRYFVDICERVCSTFYVLIRPLLNWMFYRRYCLNSLVFTMYLFIDTIYSWDIYGNKMMIIVFLISGFKFEMFDLSCDKQ